MSQSFEARLRAIEIAVPEEIANRALDRANRQAPQPHDAAAPRRIAVSLALVALLIGGNMTASYFLPRYGEKLAGASLVGAITGPVLRAAGLANARLTSANDTAVSAGHRLQLVTAYTDTDRTVLFIEIDGQPLQVGTGMPPPSGSLAVNDASVSDQFGHQYAHLRGAYSAFDPIELEPLVWPASAEGGRLTIHVTNLEHPSGPHQLIPGEWTLHVTVFQQTAQALSLPASGSIGRTQYAFTAVHLSSALLQLQVRVTGDAVTELAKDSSSRPTDAAGIRTRGEEVGRLMHYFTTTMIAPDGSIIRSRSWDAGDGEINATYAVIGPGVYHVLIGDPSIGTYDSIIVIPAK